MATKPSPAAQKALKEYQDSLKELDKAVAKLKRAVSEYKDEQEIQKIRAKVNKK